MDWFRNSIEQRCSNEFLPSLATVTGGNPGFCQSVFICVHRWFKRVLMHGANLFEPSRLGTLKRELQRASSIVTNLQ